MFVYHLKESIGPSEKPVKAAMILFSSSLKTALISRWPYSLTAASTFSFAKPFLAISPNWQKSLECGESHCKRDISASKSFFLVFERSFHNSNDLELLLQYYVFRVRFCTSRPNLFSIIVGFLNKKWIRFTVQLHLDHSLPNFWKLDQSVEPVGSWIG